MQKISVASACVLTMLFLTCTNEPPPSKDSNQEAPGDTSEQQTSPLPENVTEDSLPAQIAPDRILAAPVFIAGSVELTRGDAIRQLEIGEELQTDDYIEVHEGGFAELQIDGDSILQLDSGTSVLLESLLGESRQIRAQLYLERGKVASRVRSLNNDESYTVRTRSAAAGVRGTEFSVAEDEKTGSQVSVISGSVVVIPTEIDLESLYRDAHARVSSETFEAIYSSGIILEQDQRLAIDDRVKQLAPSYSRVITALLQSPSEDQDNRQEMLQELRLLGTELKEAAVPGIMDSAAIAQDSIRPTPGTWNTSEQLIAVEIHTIPEEAAIIIDGQESGHGYASGIFPAAVPPQITVDLDGYKPTDFQAQANNSSIYTIQLQYTGQDPEKPAAEDTHSQDTLPAADKTKSEETASNSPARGDILFVSEPSHAAVVGSPLHTEAGIVIANEHGRISLIESSTGDTAWSVATGNTSNRYSEPLVYNNNLIFSGITELVFIDLSSGEVVQRDDLSTGNSHAFGQRPMVYDGLLAIPTDNGIAFTDESMQEVAAIDIPEGAAITPVRFQQQLVSIGFSGDVLQIHGIPDTPAVDRIKTQSIQPVGQAPALHENTVFFGDRRGQIHAVDLQGNRILWNVQLPGSPAVHRSPAVADEMILVTTSDSIHALERTTGELMYQLDSNSSPHLHDDYFWYVDGNKLIQASIPDGTEAESFRLPDQAAGTPLIHSGYAFIGLTNGSVVKMKL